MHADPREVDRILPVKQAVERKIIDLPGVTGVDVGLKRVNGEKTSTHAIIVFVAHKGDFTAEHEIPATIEGVPTDVVEAIFEDQSSLMTPDTVEVDSKRYDPAQGGSMIAPAFTANAYGTVGMLVKDATSGVQLWLSAYHVMCKDEHWPDRDHRIVQPAIVYGGNAATDTIGTVVRGKYGQVDVPWGYDLYVDAAVCNIDGRSARAAQVFGGTPRGARNAQIADLVGKYGATTEYRHGVVESTNMTSKTTDGDVFYYQVRVDPPWPGAPPMGEPGDSGSAVLDSDGYAIGLHIQGSVPPYYCVINPIGQIIEALSITV